MPPTLNTPPLQLLPNLPTYPVSVKPLVLEITTKGWTLENVSTQMSLGKLDTKYVDDGEPEFGADTDPSYNGDTAAIEAGASEQTLLLDEYYHRLLLVLLPLGVALDILALLAFSHSRRKHSRCVAILWTSIPFASIVQTREYSESCSTLY